MHSESGRKRKILVIEDDGDLRRFLRVDLSVYFTVADSPNWLDAKQRLCEDVYDLILLDLILPDTSDPLEPLNAIREIDLDYPVVLTTGNTVLAVELLDRLMRLGINTVLAKPYTREELMHAIKKHITLC